MIYVQYMISLLQRSCTVYILFSEKEANGAVGTWAAGDQGLRGQEKEDQDGE